MTKYNYIRCTSPQHPMKLYMYKKYYVKTTILQLFDRDIESWNSTKVESK